MWKTQLTIASINKYFFHRNDEEHAMLSKSENIEIMITDEDEVIKEPFD